MDKQKVDMYLMTNQKYFPSEKIIYIREKLEKLEDDRFSLVSTLEMKDPTTSLVISILLGEFGVDRFMLGDTGMGILKLLTGGLCGILWIIDICSISKKVKEKNFQSLMAII